jgi:hypothetical protein
MREFKAWALISEMIEFGKMVALLQAASPTMDDRDIRDVMELRATGIAEAMVGVPFSMSLGLQLQRLAKSIKAEAIEDRLRLVTLAVEFQNNLIAELAEPTFMYLPTERATLYAGGSTSFGSAVLDRFPKAEYDIGAAARCMALDEWTAAVFHLMRVAEHALRRVAGRLGVPMAKQLDAKQWKDIIEAIDDGVAKLRNPTKGKKDHRKVQYYSEAAISFMHIKEAWRNHVSHAKATYDERETQAVWDTVRHLMQHLATRMPR